LRKAPTFAVGLIVVVAALVFGANRIVESTLDRKLAPLLARQLGLPVALAPIDANVLSLSARSTRLVLGNSTDPAIEASDVVVSFDWTDLLAGDIRLAEVQAADLTVRLSNWPGNAGPRPETYEFLESLLPKTFSLQAGRYVSREGEAWPLRNLEWLRYSDDSVSLAWSQDHALSKIGFSANLASLPDMLGLIAVNLQIQLVAANRPADGAVLDLAVEPGENGGYSIRAQADIADATVRVSAENASPWQFPESSDIYISQLRPEVVMALLENFPAAAENTDFERSLTKTLPRLDLPSHLGRLEIGEIGVADEVFVDTVIHFSTGEQGLTVSSMNSEGPSAVLEASATLADIDESWRLNVSASLTGRQASKSIAARVFSADWRWRSGRLQLDGEGDTPGSLLYSLQGELLLLGMHQGETGTPVKVQALLGKQPDSFTLDDLEIELGPAVIAGSLAFSGGAERQLGVQLEARQLDLGFLFAGADAPPEAGFVLPEYLEWLPGVEVESVVTVRDLQMPGLNLPQLDIKLVRTATGGKLAADARGVEGGEMKLQLDFETEPDLPTSVSLGLDFAAIDLFQMFGQDRGLIDSRTSGKLYFSSQGNGVREVFTAMRGNADLSIGIRSDANWNRASRPEEELRFSGASSLVIDSDRIMGLHLEDIDIDALEQDLSGKVSIVAGREPWLVAQLESDRIDVGRLLEWAPESPEGADEANLLESLRASSHWQLSFAADEVKVLDTPLQNMTLVLSSAADSFILEQLDFTFEGSRIEGQVALEWKDELTQFRAAATVADIVLDDFLYPDPRQPGIPLSGSISFAGEGTRFAEIASGLSASIDLKAQPGSGQESPRPRRQLQVDLQRLQHGVRADVRSLAWDDSELRGRVLYHNTSPPKLEIDISDGMLDLEPWEGTDTDTTETEIREEDGTPFARAARSTSRLARTLLAAPTRLLSGDTAAPSQERFFSDEILDTSFLTQYNARIKGQLSSVISREGTVRNLEFDAALADGELKLKTRAGFLNGGTADIALEYGAAPAVPTAALSLAFEDVHRNSQQLSYPRSGFIELTSSGNSQAELAARLNGVTYLELGRGPVDYGGLTLLTADIATGVFRALIPGVTQRDPELHCAVILAKFVDGAGVTPYGYAARTGTANLMGRSQVDFREETLLMRLRSRSRQGLGLTVGNAFSSTVTIRGTLRNPAIVPNTTGLLWRGWAAFMTGGMSVLGESMLNRGLASANPCTDIRNAINKDVCATTDPLAASPLVCPP
jgi:hypothetical protein